MTRPTILVVDDNEINRDICNEILCADYIVESASDGETALEMAEQSRPDLILLDIMMPGIDGLEVCRRIRQSKLRWVKVILVSAKTYVEDRLEGFEAGADDYITKPFNEDELLAKVRILLRLKHVEEIGEVKRKMLEVMQHSNRAPLATIIGNAELLSTMAESLSSGERHEIAKSIEKSSWRLMNWLESGENYLALKNGNLTLNETETDLSSLLATRLAPAETSIAFDIAIEPDVVIRCDRKLTEMFLDALIQFARSRHLDGTKLSLVRFNDGVRLELVYPAEESSMDGFFEPFRDPEDSLLNRSNGLELAVAHEIVKLHEGNVQAASGGGTTRITAYMPLGASAAVTVQRKDSDATAQI